MAPELDFRGDFPVLAKRMMVPGGWYLGFRCNACGERFAILDEPTGTGGLRTAGDAVFHAACPNCSAENDYPAGQLLTFQASAGGIALPG